MLWYNKLDLVPKKGIIIAKDINSNGCKSYSNINSREELLSIIDNDINPHYYEVIYNNNWIEVYDFDGKNINIDESIIVNNFISVYKSIYGNDNNIFVKSSSKESIISLHFIIHNIINVDKLKGKLDKLINSNLLLFKDSYDRSIYTKNRLIRTLGSSKYSNNRPFIIYLQYGDIYRDRCNYLVSLVIDNNIIHDDIKRNSLINYKSVIDNSNIIRLNRINSSMCLICCRIHDSDNAYINTNTMTYGCFRNVNECNIDSDRLIISRSKLINSLRNLCLNDKEIDYILSKSIYK